MKIKIVWPIAIICLILAVAGCGTAPKKLREEVTGIKTRVDTLESRVEGVETRQMEQERVVSEQTEKVEQLKTERRPRTNIGVRSRGGKGEERVKEIQVSLKSAGFYTGKIDGIKGRNTRKAIREFQKANGLVADGIVGKKTWELLSKYASSSVTYSGTEEGPK